MTRWDRPTMLVMYLDDKPLDEFGRRATVIWNEQPWGDTWIWTLYDGIKVVSNGECESETEACREAEVAVGLHFSGDKR